MQISYIGMQTQEVAIKPNLKVILKSDTELLDEVTVVAYGTKRKQDLVGSISSVKNEIISNSQAASVSNALEGAVAGLQVVSSSGQPGQDADIVLRGIGSISASNNALIVVDGVPFNGKLSDINPTDIASVNVSKDAVSNSLYGSRAAGGVVMITTKTGRKDKVSINFDGSWGVAQRAYKDYDMATDPGEFYRLTWYGIRNTYWAAGNSIEDSNLAASQDLLGELGNYNAYIIPQGEYLVTPDGKLNPNARLRYDDTFADALFDNAFRQEYNVSASGGNDRTDFYVSMGYLDNDSYVLGSSYERFTARANVNSQLKSWLKVGTNVGYSKATQNGVQENAGTASNPFAVARSWAPIFPVHAYDAEGNMKYYEDGRPMYDAGNGETDGTSKRPTATNQNVIANMREDIRESVYNNLTSRSYIEISFLKNFKFTANYSYDFTNDSETLYYTPTIGDGQSFGGRGTQASINTTTTNFNQILAYSNVFGDYHHLSAKVGHEYYKYEYDYFDGQKTNFFNPSNPELNNGGQMQYINSYKVNHNIEGYFGMADYDYNNKYYISAAFRRDGTSRFLDRWGNFWSVGLGWLMNKESFLQNTSWIDMLKFKISYGAQGNDNIGNYYAYLDQYTVSNSNNDFALALSYKGNKDITWETSHSFNTGFDFEFFKGRLSGTVEYFSRKTTDMLYNKPMNASAGYASIPMNVGSMTNKGVELDLNGLLIETNDLTWRMNFNLTHFKNTINELDPSLNGEMISGSYIYREGESRYQFYLRKYAGVDENGVAQYYKDITDAEGNVTGQEKTTDAPNATRYATGDILPKVYGGFGTSLNAYGFDFSISFAYQLGGRMYDNGYASLMNSGTDPGQNWHKDILKAWTADNKGSNIPRLSATDQYANYLSDRFLTKSDYLSINSITLGYTLPKSWVRSLNISSLRVYMSADNVALFSKRKGFDPRQSYTTASADVYSPIRAISGGLSLSF